MTDLAVVVAAVLAEQGRASHDPGLPVAESAAHSARWIEAARADALR
jgi:hypothetical protein